MIATIAACEGTTKNGRARAKLLEPALSKVSNLRSLGLFANFR